MSSNYPGFVDLLPSFGYNEGRLTVSFWLSFFVSFFLVFFSSFRQVLPPPWLYPDATEQQTTCHPQGLFRDNEKLLLGTPSDFLSFIRLRPLPPWFSSWSPVYFRSQRWSPPFCYPFRKSLKACSPASPGLLQLRLCAVIPSKFSPKLPWGS